MARFLALLELFREGAVAFDQVTPLGELSVRWTGTDEGEIEVADEYDEQPPGPAATSPLTTLRTPRSQTMRSRRVPEEVRMTTHETEA